MQEIWKDVVGYEGLYMVSDKGNVLSLKTNKILRPHCSKRGGYWRLILRKDGISHGELVHRLVANAFIENKDLLPQVNHKDENKNNNTVSNLEWCTHQYNNTYGTKIDRCRANTDYRVIAKKNSRTVAQYDKAWRKIKEWQSANECKRELGFDNSHIAKCCRGEEEFAYGYRWRYCAKSFSKKLYNSKAWRECRKQILRRDHYTCQECMASRAEEIHHIIELSPSNIHDERITLNPDNLISLCKACHSRITDGYTGDVADGYYFDDEGNVVKR